MKINKLFLPIFVILCLVAYIVGYTTTTTTTNLSLVKPDAEDTTTNWFTNMNTNLDLIDANSPKVKLDATSAPGVTNDTDEGYVAGSIWVDVTNDKAYTCLDNADGAAVWTETTGAGAGGYTNLTSFVDQTAWRVFYSNTAGDVIELALGADGTYLRSNGAAAAPTFTAPAGGGTVTTSGTPVANDIARFTGATVIEGLSYAEFKTALNLVVGTDIQAFDNALASISGLTYVSPSFIKLTANDTYAVRTIAEVKTDLSLNLVENTALSTWAGTSNITTVGTIGTGVWSGTALVIGKIPTAAVSNGDTANVPTCDNVFDFCETTQNYMQNLLEDTTPAYGGPMDHNNNRNTEVKTIEFNGLYDDGNSGAVATIDWQNGQYQKMAVSENTLITFSNAFIGTITLHITFSGAYTVGFNAGYTILEEGGTEISFTGTSAAVDILKVMYLGTANNYVVGIMNDVKD